MTPSNPFVTPELPYPSSVVTELRIGQARLEERVDSHEELIATAVSKIDRLTMAVVAAALSFAVGSAAVVAAVMSGM